MKGDNGSAFITGDLNSNGPFANGLKSSIVGSRDWLRLNKHKVGEGLNVGGHMATGATVVDFDSIGWVHRTRGDVGNAKRGGDTESVLEGGILVMSYVCSHDLLSIPSILTFLPPIPLRLTLCLLLILPMKRSTHQLRVLELMIGVEPALLVCIDIFFFQSFRFEDCFWGLEKRAVEVG